MEKFNNEEVSDIKAAEYLISEGLNLLERASASLRERTKRSADTTDYDEKTEEITNALFDIVEEYIPKVELKDYLQHQVVELLASDLGDMTELDEIKMTFDDIKKVINNKLTAKDIKSIEDSLSEIEHRNLMKDFSKSAFTPEFKMRYNL